MNPRIYVGALEEAVYTMSATENASFPLANLSTYIPTEVWKSSAATNGQTLKIDFGAARPRNFCILHGHNFGAMTNVSLQAADDSGYSSGLITVVSSLVHPLSVVKFEFDSVNKRYWRILFTDCNGVVPELGQIFIDQKIDFVQHYDWGFKPRNEDFESVVARPTINGIVRSARIYSGRMRYGFGWKNINNRTLEDIRWWLQKVQGGFAPFYFYDHDDERYYVRNTKNFSPATVAAFKVNDSAFFEVETLEVNQVPYTQQTNPMAIDLDGSTEYCSKTSPVNLDMNGSELLGNSTFDSNTAGWGVTGGNTLTHETTIVRTGAGAAKIQRTGSPDMRLIANGSSIAPVAGKKYTLEAWLRVPAANVSKTVALAITRTDFTSLVTVTNVVLAADTWTKVVLNFEVPAGETLSFRGTVSLVSAATGDILYADDCSLTEAYDFTGLAWVKHSSPISTYECILDVGFSYSVLLHASLQRPFCEIRDDVNSILPSTPASVIFNDGVWHLIAVTVDRDGNGICYLDAVSGGPLSVVSVGKISVASMKIGGNAAFYSGSIGELQIIRGYAMTAAQVLDIYQKGIKKAYEPDQYPGATVVAHYRWRGTSDAEFLKDETGWNNLTGIGVTQPNDQVIADYPIIEL